MTRIRLVCGLAALALVAGAPAAQAQVCAAGIIVSALVVNGTQGRPLTSQEAMTCGLTAMASKPAPAPKPAKRKNKS